MFRTLQTNTYFLVQGAVAFLLYQGQHSLRIRNCFGLETAERKQFYSLAFLSRPEDYQVNNNEPCPTRKKKELEAVVAAAKLEKPNITADFANSCRRNIHTFLRDNENFASRNRLFVLRGSKICSASESSSFTASSLALLTSTVQRLIRHDGPLATNAESAVVTEPITNKRLKRFSPAKSQPILVNLFKM